jgi:orotidine-5'-phosphate decarboxylase
MFSERLKKAVKRTGGCLCVGLDVDLAKMPEGLPKDIAGVKTFCRGIIDATKDLAAAYKPNLAFFEAMGPEGLAALEEVRRMIPPDCLVVADAKRGDIGNTSRAYAEAFFSRLKADALTVAPYMGRDSVEPFLQFEGTCIFVLGLTSNPGSADFQMLELKDGGRLFERVVATAAKWGEGAKGEVGLVVGATKAEMLTDVRNLAPDNVLLIPGVGAQGGDLEAVMKSGKSRDGYGMLVNASRSILYASKGADWKGKARDEAGKTVSLMRPFIP